MASDRYAGRNGKKNGVPSGTVGIKRCSEMQAKNKLKE
jgi:hypothetical protein